MAERLEAIGLTPGMAPQHADVVTNHRRGVARREDPDAG